MVHNLLKFSILYQILVSNGKETNELGFYYFQKKF